MENQESNLDILTGEGLLSLIEEDTLSTKKDTSNNENHDSEIQEKEEEEYEYEYEEEEEYEYEEGKDVAIDEDEEEDEAKKKKPKTGKKEILIFASFGIALIAMGTFIYMMLFSENNNEISKITPVQQQKKVPKKVIKAKPIIKSIKKSEAKPLKILNPSLQEKENIIVEAQKPQQKEVSEENKTKAIVFKVKSQDDLGINQFVVIGEKAYLSSDLFEEANFKVEDKEYHAVFNGKMKSFLRVIGKDALYLPSKQVSENYSVVK